MMDLNKIIDYRNSDNNIETSNFRLFPLTTLLDNLTSDVNPIDAITIAIPALVAMNTSITDN